MEPNTQNFHNISFMSMGIIIQKSEKLEKVLIITNQVISHQ